MAASVASKTDDAESAISGFATSANAICRAVDHCLQYMSMRFQSSYFIFSNHFFPDNGLSKTGGTQIPSYVTSVPDGSETGIFLTVDLGGTNCRICAVELHGNSKYSMTQSKHAVPAEVMVNDSHRPLFEFIANRIAAFLDEHPELDIKDADEDETVCNAENYRKLGFTFSFTYDSHSASRGTMLQWDKGWDIPDAIGRDPCRMLQDAIDSLNLRVRVTALTNDSVGTLMAQAYTSSENFPPLIGAIFGTGTNAAYVENLTRIKKLPGAERVVKPGTEPIMIVNTEWGAWFDDAPGSLPTCTYDNLLDHASQMPGEQLFEKRTSALYLGELARLAISDMIATQELDMMLESGSPLEKPYNLSSEFLSTLALAENGASGFDTETLKQTITSSLHVQGVSNKDAEKLSRLGAAIVKRSAQLAGVAIAAIIVHSGKMTPKSQAASTNFERSRSWLCHWQGLCNAIRKFTAQPKDAASVFDSDSTLNADGEGIDIGIDGSLFEHYPKFEEHIRQALRMVPRIGDEGEARVTIGLAKDGSSLGAALIAQSIP